MENSNSSLLNLLFFCTCLPESWNGLWSDSGVLQPDRRGSYTSGIREQHRSVTRRIEEFALNYNSQNKALNPQTGLFLSNELTTCANMYKDVVKKKMKISFPKLVKMNERR